MANHRSAVKRHRQSLVRRERNQHLRTTVRNAIRKARKAIETGGKAALAEVQAAERILRKGATKGILHTRTADRTVSRLHRALNARA
jgi:small subunit ribosomal protein S20